MVDATELIENNIGKFGRWQVVLVVLIYLSRFSVAYHTLMMVVQHNEPKCTCASNAELDCCDKGCDDYEFDKTHYDETVPTYWGLICDKRWITSTIQCMVMLGILLGNVTLGWVSDRFGRKNILILEMVLQVTTGTLAGFMTNLPAFIVFRFLSAYATGGMMLTTFVLLMEFTAKKYRVLLAICFHPPFQVAHATIGVIAMYLRKFSDIQILCSSVSVILIFLFFLLPESVRWLLTKDRVPQAVKVLEKAAKCNRLPTENIEADVNAFVQASKTSEPVPSGRIADLVRTTRMRTKIIVLALDWFVIACGYYGVAELMGKIGGNPFLNVVFSGLVQIPGTLSCILFCKYLGNKNSQILSFVLSFMPLFIMACLPEEPKWPVVMCGCISMMGVAMSFAVIYLYTAELIPTVIRNLGMGVTSMIARCGSMSAPYIMLCKHVNVIIPYLVFGGLPVIAAALTLFLLPQTKNVDMPDTVEQADKL